MFRRTERSFHIGDGEMSTSPNEITISIIKEIDGTSRNISIRMSYDNRPGFVQNVWLAELLLDGQQVDVTVHSYPEEIATPIEDSTAIVRAQADIINSKQMVSELTSFLVYATNLPEAEASGTINELVEIATGRDKEVYRLCPQICAEMDRINAENARKVSVDSGKVEPTKIEENVVALLQEPITENVVVSVNRDGREISLKMSYDDRRGFIENVWIVELLLDGNSIIVPKHSYAEPITDTLEDSTAIARDFVNITHSKKMVSDLIGFLAYATNLSEAESSRVINELVEIAKGRSEEIARIDPKTDAEFRRTEVSAKAIETSGGLPYKSSKPIKMETKYKLDKNTNRLYNSETLKYFDVKTGMDSDENYIPEPEVKPENETIKNTIQIIKGDSGDTRYTYPEISLTKEIEGVTKEIGVKIIFEKRVFGASLWHTELLIDGEVTDESGSEESFIVSAKAQTDIQNFITRTLELAPQQADEIVQELISATKKHETDILSMVEIQPKKEFAGLEGDDRLKAILEKDYEKSGNRDSDIKFAKLFVGSHFYDKSEEEAFKFIDSHLKEHYGFNDKDIRGVKSYCSETIKDHSFLHENDTDEDCIEETKHDSTKSEETNGKPEDGKRAEFAEVIMKAKLHVSTEEKLAELAERYDTPIDTIRDMFYDAACAINFNTTKDIKGEVKRALEKLHFTCHNKFKKHENVTLSDAGAQFLYGKIERVLISKGVDLVDVPNWEFWFDDQIDGKKIIIPATALNTMLVFDKLYLATFSRPAPILKKVVWRELLEELYEYKAKEVLDTDDSDIINVAKIFFEKICAMPVTTDDIEQVVTGQAMHEFKGAYFITSTKIEEIREEMKCGFTTRKINEALVRLKYKEKGTEQHWLGKKQQRCWKFSKDAVDQRNKEQDSEEM